METANGSVNGVEIEAVVELTGKQAREQMEQQMSSITLERLSDKAVSKKHCSKASKSG